VGGDPPASFAQKRLWILDRIYPGCAAYAVPVVYRIAGQLDVQVLAGALSEVVRRHEVLRTGYRMVSGVLCQVIRTAEPVTIPLADVTGYQDPAAEAERLACEQAREPFGLRDGPVVRALLVRTAADRHLLCLTIHHIACDGWSLQLLENELSAYCRSLLDNNAVPGLPPPPQQYADFARLQASRLTGGALDRDRDYWRDRLDGLPPLASIPPDRPRPAVWSFVGAHVPFTLEPRVAAQAELLARAYGTTPYAVMLAAFAALIHEQAGAAEVVVGAPASLREQESQYSLIGMFGNTVVLRLPVSEGMTFRQLVFRARDETRNAIAHQALPFEVMVEELNPVRDPGANPLFQLMFSYQTATTVLQLPGCEVVREFGDTGTAKVDLSVGITREVESCSGRLEYSRDLFEETTARRLAARFATLLDSATAMPLREIGLMS
jgi:Condensation domain